MDYLGSKEIQELFTLLAEVMNSQKEEPCRLSCIVVRSCLSRCSGGH
jgi:hypothetical protein